MSPIRELVKEALETGYLTLEAQEQLRQLFTTTNEIEDLHAFMTLQHAAMSGKIRQQSRQNLTYSQA